jgi:hypothetical protein
MAYCYGLPLTLPHGHLKNSENPWWFLGFPHPNQPRNRPASSSRLSFSNSKSPGSKESPDDLRMIGMAPAWHKHPGGIFTVRIFITKLLLRHSETSILTEKRGLRTWGFNFSIDNPLSVFSSSRGPKSNQDSCLMNVAVVFNNSRGFSHRHWNDLTYRNILTALNVYLNHSKSISIWYYM